MARNIKKLFKYICANLPDYLCVIDLLIYRLATELLSSKPTLYSLVSDTNFY